jgi:hypothetical protein
MYSLCPWKGQIGAKQPSYRIASGCMASMIMPNLTFRLSRRLRWEPGPKVLEVEFLNSNERLQVDKVTCIRASLSKMSPIPGTENFT